MRPASCRCVPPPADGTLNDEVTELSAAIASITATADPVLHAQFDLGPQVAAALLIAAGRKPDRMRNEASLAALCGVNPWPASSGKTRRHRLNRGGDRQAKPRSDGEAFRGQKILANRHPTQSNATHSTNV